MSVKATTKRVQDETVTIASGQTTSGEYDLLGNTLVGFHLPAAFTGTAITFTASKSSGGTFQAVKDGAGSTYTLTVAQGQYIPVDPVKMLGVRFIKFVSGSTEGADRVITPISMPI